MNKFYKPVLSISLFFAAVFTANASTDTLVAAGASWKYLDNGTNQGTSWRATGFNDASWASGNAELGYGDGDESTVVSYGSNASNKYITTYFRKSITISNPSAYVAMALEILRDDGAVVYINGTEVYRTNMPTGTISYNTLASGATGSETTWFSSSFSTSYLVAGTNQVAVEIHQSAVNSSDLSFNFRLSGSTTPTITRGPYLQVVTPSFIILRWKTNVATDSKVRCGLSTSSYSLTFSDATAVTDHEVKLTGLSANTKYYYTVENGTALIEGDADNYFQTSPATGTDVPVRIWAIGDFGNNSSGQAAVRDAYKNYTGSTYTNLWLWMGDNAYNTGTDAEYQSNVFDIYTEQFRSMPVYPSLGNHDYANAGYLGASALTTSFPYFTIFNVPTAAEAGGLASGTEKYYSYNYANIHFVALDTYGAYNNSGSAMYTWLNNDLAANTQQWTIVYFHHPPYTKGSHNSDASTESINVRQNLLPILENHHVDLVLSGHSHANERSYLIKGHYGVTSTYNSSTMLVAGGSGAMPNPYVKTSPYNGTIYAVCGTSGQLSGTTQSGYPISFMEYSDNAHNSSIVIDINDDTLSFKYLGSDQSILDQFTMVRADALGLPVEWLTFTAAPALNVVEVAWTTVSEINNDFFAVERSTDGINFEELARIKGEGNTVRLHNYMYEDKNPYHGLSFYRLRQTDYDKRFSYSEVIAVNITQPNFITAYPNPVRNTLEILFTADNKASYAIDIVDAKGTQVYHGEVTSKKGSNNFNINMSAFNDGLYILKLSPWKGKAYVTRFAKTSN